MTAPTLFPPFRRLMYQRLIEGGHAATQLGARFCYDERLDCGHEREHGIQDLSELPPHARIRWTRMTMDVRRRVTLPCEECPPLPRGIVYLTRPAPCRHCGVVIEPEGRIGTPARYHRSGDRGDELWSARPTSRYSHWRDCPTTIEIDPAGLQLMLLPGMSIFSTAAQIHLMRLSRAESAPMPDDLRARVDALLHEVEDLHRRGFRSRMVGGNPSDRRIAAANFELAAAWDAYPSRWWLTCLDMEAWYRLHRIALDRIARGESRREP